jgi:glyoxylase-like metal-dependent hydrolase (beta-lactamase superfamily II)
MKENTVMEKQALKVQRLGVGFYGNNAYLVQDQLQGCCVLIDAAAEGDALLQAIGPDRLVAIILTHAHMDHIQALEEVRKKAPQWEFIPWNQRPIDSVQKSLSPMDTGLPWGLMN